MVPEKQELEFYVVLSVVIFGILFAQFFLVKVNLGRALWWDEAIYILMAKSIVSGGEIGFFEAFRPLVWPILLSPFQWISNQRALVVSLSVLLNLTNLLLVYLIFKKMTNRMIALVSLPFIFFFSSVLKLSLLGLSEHIAILFGLLALLLYFNNKKKWAALFSGLAFLSRFIFGVVFLGILISEIFDFLRKLRSTKENKEQIYESEILSVIWIISIFLIVITPYLVWMKISFGSFFYAFKRAAEVLAISGGINDFGPFYYLIELLKRVPFVVLFPFSLIHLFKKGNRKETIAFFTIILVMFLYISFFVQHKELRYLNFVVFLVVPISLSILTFLWKIKKRVLRASAKLSVLVFLWLLFFCVELPSAGYLFEGFGKSHLTDFIALIPKNESEIISSDPILGVYINAKIFTFSNDYYGFNQLNNSEAHYLFRNNCSLLCPSNLSMKCESARKKLLDFLSNKTLVETRVLDSCNISLYKIR